LKNWSGEGIRTLDPNLGKIRLDELLTSDKIVILALGKSQHELNIFSGIFSEGFVFRFPDKCGAAALYPKLAMDVNVLRTQKSPIKSMENRSI